MNKTFTRYAARTGRVIDQINIPDTSADYDMYANLLYEDAVDGATHYFVKGVPTQRPMQSTVADKTEIIADGMDVVTVIDMPIPCDIMVSGPHGVTVVASADGNMVFSADLPGDYSIRLESFPFIPMEIMIHAN